MAKLQLKAAPTFRAKVGIPVAGGESVPVEFTFKHRTKDQLHAWLAAGKDRPDVDSILDMAEAWDLDEPFNRDSVSELAQQYIGAPVVLVQAYIQELTKARLGN